MTIGLNATCYFGLLLTSALFLDEQEPKLARDVSRLDASPRFVGTEACVHCHKGGHDFPSHATAGNEYSIWISSDPHSGAYITLFSEQSKSIANRLKLESLPHKSDLCLACHATHVPDEMKAPGSKLNPADGVGCESCHGGAENWLVAHKLADWPFWSATQKESTGFVNTDNFASRTRKCIECHVGSEGREVNHDLIAAGHPRLLFEMSAHQAMLPRHWSRAKDLAQNGPDGEAKLWLVGQIVSATASLDLLQRRANQADAPWPEFAEYDCSSCHHDLAEQRWKNGKLPHGTSVGRPDWGTWHYSMLHLPLTGGSLLEFADLDSELDRLRKEMQITLPNRRQVAEIANDLKKRLEQIAEQLSTEPLDEDFAIGISDLLFSRHPGDGEMKWDQLAQRYLAAVALRQSLMDSRQLAGRSVDARFEDSGNQLLEIRDLLKFSENHQRPERLDTPRSRTINQRLFDIFDCLEN